MRLLNASTHQLSEFYDEGKPPYAILSHCWGSDEVLFQDLGSEKRFQKLGFAKITYTCQQARRHKLEWVWIDTCCIDKSSSAELSEAINSMFNWYSEAAVCYAYLPDVRHLDRSPNEESPTDGSSSEGSFAASLWFTRGWTLQELVAPTEVKFYGEAWKPLTTRSAAAEQIAGITGVDARVLTQHLSLNRFSVAHRMSWAVGRNTTRIEDKSYSLLGIFGVNMPLIYGEGKRAFRRLQEEVMKVTADLSILAWSHPLAACFGRHPLTLRVEDFIGCKSLVQADKFTRTGGTIVTNDALRISAPVVEVVDVRTSRTKLAVILNCRYENDITTVIGLKVSRTVPAVEGASDQETMHCRVGWSPIDTENRLVKVDVLHARTSRLRSLMIGTDLKPRLDTIELQRSLAYLWVRFQEPHKAWRTVDFWPHNYWDPAKRTFDLAAARLDKLRWKYEGRKRARTSVSTVPFSDLAVSNVPVCGGIALQDENGFRLAIYFCERTEVGFILPAAGMTFRIAPYDPESFRSPDQSLLGHSADRTQATGLPDGTTFQVALQSEHISGHRVAHLAVKILPPQDAKQVSISKGQEAVDDA